MKLSDVKVGMKVEIVSLGRTNVGESGFVIGDILTIKGETHLYTNKHTFRVIDANGKHWCINHADIEPIIEYTHPMQEYLGREVYVACKDMRGFVVSYSLEEGDTDLLVDLGADYNGHRGTSYAVHPQKTSTNCWFEFSELDFLTEDDE